jgi:Protein of unknown function (DUF3024)
MLPMIPDLDLAAIRDPNERWHRYQTGPAANVRSLLDEIDHDPTGIFWG